MAGPTFKDEEARNRLAQFNQLTPERVRVAPTLEGVRIVRAETTRGQQEIAVNTQRTFVGALKYFESMV
ncbi:MAG: hypothetical protein ABII22_05400 [Candidatus Micrarchaeota archaeon]